MDISKIIGLSGGTDSTWFEVLSEEGRGKTKYYPAVVDGEERGWSEFDSLDDYMAAKVERERETIRLTIAGNAVVAEDAISRVLGCKALATTPHTVDVYPDHPLVDTASAAAALGSMTSEAKAEAARRNGRKGGRPKKIKESKMINISDRYGDAVAVELEDYQELNPDGEFQEYDEWEVVAVSETEYERN